MFRAQRAAAQNVALGRSRTATSRSIFPSRYRFLSSTGKDDKADPMRELLARFSQKTNSTAQPPVRPREARGAVQVGVRKAFSAQKPASNNTAYDAARMADRLSQRGKVQAKSYQPYRPGAQTDTVVVDPIRDAMKQPPRTMIDSLKSESRPSSNAAAARPPIQNKFNTKPTSNIEKLTQSTNAASPTMRAAKTNTAYDSAALKKRVMESFAVGQSAAAGRRVGSINRGESSRLEGLSRGLPAESSIPDSDVPEMTENEWQHERKQEHLRRKREMFDKNRPPGPPDSSWEAKPGGGGDSSTVLDVAAMKQLYENRLHGNKFGRDNKRPKPVATTADKEAAFRVFNQLPGARKKLLKGMSDVKEAKGPQGTVVKEVVIPDGGLSVRELSSRLSMKVETIRHELVKLGEDIDGPEYKSTGGGKRRRRMKRIQSADGTGDNKIIDADVAELLVLELGYPVQREQAEREFAAGMKGAYSTALSTDTPSYPTRDPIVCVMGHVDHGKTTLMDRLRSANVAAGEAGGITQKLSAFAVDIGSSGRKAVFIDTPGHAAFGGMRSSGASATDVVILVVAMDDGVRPQTAEVIKLVQKTKCSLVIALNKMDKIPTSERAAAKQRVLGQLMDLEVAVEEYGGDVVCTEISGKNGDGVDTLLEGLLLQADILELSAPAEGLAEATILDSRFEKGKGVVADCLVRWGQLEVGDTVVVGTTFGTVKSMVNDAGKRLKNAGPSTAVQLLGLKSVPSAGQELLSVDSEEEAKRIVDRRVRVAELKRSLKEASKASTERDIGMQVHAVIPGSGGAEAKTIVVNAVDTVGVKGFVSAKEAASKLLEEQGAVVDEAAMASAESVKNATLNVILKADGVGSLEALQQITDGLNDRTDDARIRVINSSVGAIVKSDIDFLATAEKGVIFGFNIGFADTSVKTLAKHKKIDVLTESVVYRLEDEMVKRLEELMPVERKLISQGSGKVLQLFPLNAKTKTVVAGLSVTRGTINSGKDYIYTVKRGGKAVLEESVPGDSTLRRFKDVVGSVAQGFECGLSLLSYNEFEEGDEIECFKIEHAVKVLQMHPDANKEYSSGGPADNYSGYNGDSGRSSRKK